MACRAELSIERSGHSFHDAAGKPSRFDDFRSIFADIAHLQQDMSVQAGLLLPVHGSMCAYPGLLQALQKDIAETAVSGTPDSKYEMCGELKSFTHQATRRPISQPTNRQVQTLPSLWLFCPIGP